MLIFAHRGASGNFPENTTSAFEAALEANIDGIELDVQSCADDFVIIHDSWLDRTTNGHGRVVNTPFSEINKLDAGLGQTVLNLQQVLTLIGKRTAINLELKHTFNLDELVHTLEQNIHNETITQEQLIISSFDHHQLKWLKNALPWIKIGALTASVPLNYALFATHLNAFSIHIDKNFINQDFVSDAKKRGLKVFVYTVDKQQEILEMQALGVDGIFTNYPNYAKMILSP